MLEQPCEEALAEAAEGILLCFVESKACSHCCGVLDVQSGIAGASPAATIETTVKGTGFAEEPCGSAAARIVAFQRCRQW